MTRWNSNRNPELAAIYAIIKGHAFILADSTCVTGAKFSSRPSFEGTENVKTVPIATLSRRTTRWHRYKHVLGLCGGPAELNACGHIARGGLGWKTVVAFLSAPFPERQANRLEFLNLNYPMMGLVRYKYMHPREFRRTSRVESMASCIYTICVRFD